MRLSFVNKPSKQSLVIYPVFEKEKTGNKALNKVLEKLKKNKEFEAKEGSTFYHYSGKKSIPDRMLFLGLGKEKKLTVASVMNAFGVAVKTIHRHQPKHVSVLVPEALFPFSQPISEAIALANYQPAAAYKTGKSFTKLRSQRIEILEIVVKNLGSNIRADFQKGFLVSKVVNELREWVNGPPNRANGSFFEEKGKEIAAKTGAKLTVLRKKDLEKLGMHAFLAVNRGSSEEARLIILDYNSNVKEPPIVFVGKGVLFDSGGYNLKPSGFIENMQLDKAGAVTVLALIKILHLLKIKHRVISVGPFTENLIGANAMKPSEIIKTYSGKTVEIMNTDAEGRLILGDAIAYAIDQYKPRYLIDIATLTGACMIALGERYAGLFGNDKELMDQLRTASEEVDEPFWPMPIHKDDALKIKGEYADLKNADLGTERFAGASKGAAFLQAFVGKTKWAHLDIAGPAFVKDPKQYEQKGATGFGLRGLVRFLEKL